MVTSQNQVRHFFTSGRQEENGGILSMCISADSFLYTISKDGRIFEACEVAIELSSSEGFQTQLDHLLLNYQLVKNNYERVIISLLNRQFTIVPEAYYNAEATRKLLNFTTGKHEEVNINSHTIGDFRFCYPVQADLNAYLGKVFPNIHVLHAGAVACSAAGSHHSVPSGGMLLNITGGMLEVTMVQNDAVVFYNCFVCQSAEDFLYYLLFIVEELKQDAAAIRVVIAADIPVSDPLIASIRRFIPHLSFVTPDPSLVLSGNVATMPNHYFFTVLHQPLCGL